MTREKTRLTMKLEYKNKQYALTYDITPNDIFCPDIFQNIKQSAEIFSEQMKQLLSEEK